MISFPSSLSTVAAAAAAECEISCKHLWKAGQVVNLRARHTVYNTPTLAMFSGPHGADKPAAILSVPFIANYLQNLRNRIPHHTPPM